MKLITSLYRSDCECNDVVSPSIYLLPPIFDLGRLCVRVYLGVEAIMNDPWSYLLSSLAGVTSLVVFLGILVWIVRICAADARRRGESPFLVTLLVFVSFPLGLLLWLLFRPEPLNGGGQSFRLSDHRLSDHRVQ